MTAIPHNGTVICTICGQETEPPFVRWGAHHAEIVICGLCASNNHADFARDLEKVAAQFEWEQEADRTDDDI